MAQRNGTGMFPREVMNRFPLLPLEEEGRPNDMPLRENFIERVFAYYRWTEMLDREPTPGGLVKFHTAHKLTLMAHSPKHYTEMGRLVADAGKKDWDELTAEYGAMLMEGLDVMGTRGKHVNVLQHLMGYLKKHLSTEDKQELLGLIEDYRQGLVPPIVPLTLLKHHLNRHPVPEWVHQQVYLHPYPKELMLRNHVQAGLIRFLASRRSGGRDRDNLPDLTSPGQTRLHKPRERHSSPIGHLPLIPDTGTMYSERLGSTLDYVAASRHIILIR